MAEITAPTLIIHREADAIVPLEGAGTRAHAAIPGGELHVIPDGPHAVDVSHADEWNRVVAEFLHGGVTDAAHSPGR